VTVRYPRGLHDPKVLALLLLGGAAFVASFVISGTPEHTVQVGRGTFITTANTHPIDVVLFVCRVGGGLTFIIGVLALIAYSRGEMDLPAEAVAPESHTMDDDLPPTPPGNFIFRT